MVSRRVSAAQCQRSCPVLQWAGGRSGADSGDLRLWRWVRARTRWCHERVKDRMARTGIHRPLQATDRLATAHGRVRASLRRCGRAFRGLPGPACRLLPGGAGGGPLPGASGPSPTRYPGSAASCRGTVGPFSSFIRRMALHLLATELDRAGPAGAGVQPRERPCGASPSCARQFRAIAVAERQFPGLICWLGPAHHVGRNRASFCGRPSSRPPRGPTATHRRRG